MFERIAGYFSFAGGIVLIFLTVAFVVIKGATGENLDILETNLMIMIVVFGYSTMYYVVKSGVGKGKYGSKG